MLIKTIVNEVYWRVFLYVFSPCSFATRRIPSCSVFSLFNTASIIRKSLLNAIFDKLKCLKISWSAGFWKYLWIMSDNVDNWKYYYCRIMLNTAAYIIPEIRLIINIYLFLIATSRTIPLYNLYSLCSLFCLVFIFPYSSSASCTIWISVFFFL